MTSRDFKDRPSRQASMAARSMRLASRKERASRKLSASRSARDWPYTAPGRLGHAQAGAPLSAQTDSTLGIDRHAPIGIRQLKP
jgi:hypothetical protein